MLSPRGGPQWLKSFGLDAQDINSDGYLDIVCGKYFYLNPGGDMSDTWERADFRAACDETLFVNVDGDRFADVIAQNLPDVIWSEDNLYTLCDEYFRMWRWNFRRRTQFI